MQEPPKEDIRRPQALTVLCILSFVWGVISLLANGFMFLTIEEWRLAYDEGMFEMFKDQLELESIQLMLNANPLFYLFQAILFMFSVIGVYMMWSLKKQGFHLYAIAQILMLIIYKVFLPSAPFPLLPLAITITFILLYYRNLQFMK